MTYQFKERKECDLVVIGGGGGGMIAAARAAWLSNAKKKVIVLEKTSHVGGSGVFACAIRTFGSKWQKERRLPDVMNEFVLCAMENTYWRLDSRVVGNVYRATGEFFDWLLEAGRIPPDKFEVGRYAFDPPEGPQVPLSKPWLIHKAGGYLTMEAMLELCNKLGVEILTGHRAVDVEVKKGKISAIIAKTPSGHIRVGCKSCVLASGSWVNNKRLMKKYAPVFLEMDPALSLSEHHNPNLTGDGIALAKKAGAVLDYDSFCMQPRGPMYGDVAELMYTMGKSPFSVVVNLNGKRWACEPIQNRMGTFNAGHVFVKQPKGVCYAIFDENTLAATIKMSKSKETLEASPPPHTVLESFSGAWRSGLEFPETMEEVYSNFNETLRANEGKAFRADTIEKLARKIGVAPKALKETITAYNESCKVGMDWDYFKPAKYMVPLNKGPYYAAMGVLASDGPFGGVPVNEDMQAYKQGGGLVEGLYVVGDFASGKHIVMGGVKVQVLNDFSWASAGGFIAGNSAAKYLESL